MMMQQGDQKMAAMNDAITQNLIPDLGDDLKSRSATGAAAKLKDSPGGPIAATLARLNPGFAQDVLEALPSAARERAFSAASAELSRQWQRNAAFPKETIGRMMEPVIAGDPPDQSGRETIGKLRNMVKTTFFSEVNALVT